MNPEPSLESGKDYNALWSISKMVAKRHSSFPVVKRAIFQTLLNDLEFIQL